jgi:hypothetical protein
LAGVCGLLIGAALAGTVGQPLPGTWGEAAAAGAHLPGTGRHFEGAAAGAQAGAAFEGTGGHFEGTAGHWALACP